MPRSRPSDAPSGRIASLGRLEMAPFSVPSGDRGRLVRAGSAWLLEQPGTGVARGVT